MLCKPIYFRMNFLHHRYDLRATVLTDDRLNQYGSLDAAAFQFLGIRKRCRIVLHGAVAR